MCSREQVGLLLVCVFVCSRSRAHEDALARHPHALASAPTRSREHTNTLSRAHQHALASTPTRSCEHTTCSRKHTNTLSRAHQHDLASTPTRSREHTNTLSRAHLHALASTSMRSRERDASHSHGTRASVLTCLWSVLYNYKHTHVNMHVQLTYGFINFSI